MTLYLSAEDVIAIQRDLIVRYGGAHGLRDVGLLEAAVHRPQSGYYEDVIAEAAAFWESLSQNHPFIDGNKRVGFAVTYSFLVMNGWEIIAEAEATFAFIDNLYGTHSFTAPLLENWLRDNVAPIGDTM